MDELAARLYAFLAAHTVLALATIGPNGEPQAADVYYACPRDLMLYFVSAPDSRHAANIARDPRVAGTVHAQSMGWRDIRGVQLEGICTRLTGAEQTAAWAQYLARFPFILTDPTLLLALKKVSIFRVKPHWLRWIDNSVALGHHQEYRP